MKPGDRIFFQGAYWTVSAVYPGLHCAWIAAIQDGEGAIGCLMDGDEYWRLDG